MKRRSMLQRRRSAPALAAVQENNDSQHSSSEYTDEELQLKKYQSRLRAFYWAHDPRKVDAVEEMLEGHRGKEEELLQRVHMQFGVRDFSGDEAIDDIYEHQRYSYLSFSWGSSYPGHLLPMERRRWSGLHGAPSSQKREKVEPQLPVHWRWTSDWEVDTKTTKCDDEGWVYAFDFSMINHMVKKNGGRKEPHATDYVRRRRWIRRRQRIVDAPVPIDDDSTPLLVDPAGNMAALSRLSDEENNNTVGTNLDIDDSEGEDPGEEEDDEEEDEETLKILSNTTNPDKAAANAATTGSNSTATPPSTAGAATSPPSQSATPLKYFSLTAEAATLDAAWNQAVKELEAIYTRAKNHQILKKKQWSVKKEKIGRQIHLLEKTIASMQEVALDEAKRRQGSLSCNSSPRSRPFIRSPLSKEAGKSPSPGETRTSSPTSTQGSSHHHENGCNPINLAVRMRCAQSKLDSLKRLYWHPREKHYTLRFSIDGIFYGLRDFLVESFKSSYSIHLSHQSNGAQGITPTCKITMKGHTVCCGKHVKVVGDKGTRVPKSIWDRMYLDTDFLIQIYLIYVDDPANPDAPGKWEFLLTQDATRVELTNFTRRVKGGMDLPESVVRKLCSDVLTSLVRDLALTYFPYELSIAFSVPPANLHLDGEIEITGPSIDDVMEQDIEFIDPTEEKQEQSENLLLVAAATQLLSLLATKTHMKQIAQLLHLTPRQLNLLVAINECGLYPSSHSFRSVTAICNYYNTFVVDEREEEGQSHVHKLRETWKQVLEIVYIRKMKAFKATNSHSTTEGKAMPSFELFNMDDFFAVVDRLTKKPADLKLTVTRLHCTVKAVNVVEALAKLYERFILGIDFSTPRTDPDSFIYGFRFGRKPTFQTAFATAAVMVANAKTGTQTPTSSAHQMNPALHLQMDANFRARLKAFSKFCRSLKALIEFVKQNMDQVSAEIAGNIKGTGNDCNIEGSFKDVEFVGPVNASLAIPPCFLGMYRMETVATDKDRVGLQVDLMLPVVRPRSPKEPRRMKKDIPTALISLCRLVVSELETEVLIDVDALMEHRHSHNRSIAQETTAPWTPSASFARKIEEKKTQQKHMALGFSFGSVANDSLDLDDTVIRVPSTNSNAFGKMKLTASEFTKIHANAKAGTFSTRALPLLNILLTKFVRPMVHKSFPEHQGLYDSIQTSVLQWICSDKMEMDFDVLTKVFIHGEDSLMFTFCGSPLHPTPIVYKDELFLLSVILQADDLVNLWIDERYPPYSNPLYF